MIGFDLATGPDQSETCFVIHPSQVPMFAGPDGMLPPGFVVQQLLPRTLPTPKTTIVTSKRTIRTTQAEDMSPAELAHQIYQAKVTAALCRRLDAIADQQAPHLGDTAPMPETWWEEASNFDIQRWIRSEAWQNMKPRCKRASSASLTAQSCAPT